MLSSGPGLVRTINFSHDEREDVVTEEMSSSGSGLVRTCGPTGMVQGSTEMREGFVVHPVP